MTAVDDVEDGVTTVLPPCPRSVAIGVGETVLEHAGPLTEQLVEHGPKAHRRAWFRQVRNALDVVVVAAVAWWFLDFSVWWVVALAVAAVLLGAAVGEASYRHLGHRLSGAHLVAGSGVLAIFGLLFLCPLRVG